jgi:hypothetical protein
MPCQFQIHFRFVQVTVGFDNTLEITRSEQRLRSLFECISKFFEIVGKYGQAGRSGMTAKFQQKARVAFGNEIQCIP